MYPPHLLPELQGEDLQDDEVKKTNNEVMYPPHLLPEAQGEDLQDDEVSQEGHARQTHLLEGPRQDGPGLHAGEQVAAAQLLGSVRRWGERRDRC